ncbi:cupin domain-containing protein [Plantactinospora endophytica]|uniref:Ribbon-helix-helix protein CopG domain-containing protein n=1 Tax=Plantactinospora endophytica TaxID=673535 RepID=A0ABQ4E4A5_9ACTN|nr:hypothetical protein [Plantactinospora endophytica]GIG89146.1 hypothetical protein Pen02_40820 [Plantactinospora endophytica]
MDTTIKVDAAVRDRLAVIARERGVTVRDLVAELSNGTPTAAELRERADSAARYLRSRLGVDLDADDISAGERFWQGIASGVAPSTLDGVVRPPATPRG